MERVFADETEVFRWADELLRSGGEIAAVSTGGDAARMAKAVDVLEAQGANPVPYWASPPPTVCETARSEGQIAAGQSAAR